MTKIEMGKTYVTKADGWPVEVLKVDLAGICPVLVVITSSNGARSAYLHTSDGRHLTHSNLDLIEVKPKRQVEFWLNIYPYRDVMHSSRITADNSATPSRTACLYFFREYTEGEGLDNE
jgi:hypothetical protein